MDTGKIAKKRKRETEVVNLMITLYCHENHKTKGHALCPECSGLKQYANARVAHCPHMETKTFCSNCKTHCYKPDMREKIRTVMRYSGPRMLFYHPVLAIRHVIESKKEKRKLQ